MNDRREVTIGLQWDVTDEGSYEDGLKLGHVIAHDFLGQMGSGLINVKNTALPCFLKSFDTTKSLYKTSGMQLYLDGQLAGFLRNLSAFLVVSAYMNNCGLNESNDNNPALIKRPLGFQ